MSDHDEAAALALAEVVLLGPSTGTLTDQEQGLAAAVSSQVRSRPRSSVASNPALTEALRLGLCPCPMCPDPTHGGTLGGSP